MDTELKKLGYDSFFESNRTALQLDGSSVARVIAEHKGAYRVRNANGEFLAKITGKQMFHATSRADYPAVGDWVAMEELGAEQAVIRAVLPRRTVIQRKRGNRNDVQIIAANIDVALVVESIDRDYNLNRFERYFAIARETGVRPAILLNKVDLIPQDELNLMLAEIRERFQDIDVISTSTVTNTGLDELRAYIQAGKTYCFLGSSGVGKSSLINRLLGEDVIRTATIDPYSGRGKHATTNREMYFLGNGGIVIDNPGMREVGMTDTETGVDTLFDDILELARKCRYSNCTHVGEPGCAVRAGITTGALDEKRYTNYMNLRKETKYFELTKLEKREKDHKFGKFLKTAKKDIKQYKP